MHGTTTLHCNILQHSKLSRLPGAYCCCPSLFVDNDPILSFHGDIRLGHILSRFYILLYILLYIVDVNCVCSSCMHDSYAWCTLHLFCPALVQTEAEKNIDCSVSIQLPISQCSAICLNQKFMRDE